MRKCLIFLIAAAFMVVSVMPASAQDDGAVSISGGVMLQTFWNNVDSTMNNIINGGAAPFSDTDVNWSIVTPGTSITFNFKKGDISGRITMRPFIAPAAQQVWGAWNFGAGTLTIGNFNMPFSNRTQAALHHLGGNAHWAGNIDVASRDQGLMLTFPLGGGSLKFAAMRPSGVARAAPSVVTVAAGAPAATTDTDTVIPKLEASWDVKFGGFNLWIGGGYQTYAEVVGATDKEYDFDAWGIGLYGSYGFGPVTVNASVHRVQNPREYGAGINAAPHPVIAFSTGPAWGAAYDSTTDSIVDSDWTGFHLSAGWKISDMLSLQAGWGTNKLEADRNPGAGDTTDNEDNTQFYYINMPIFAAKGLTITPEIGVRDEDDAKYGSGRAATGNIPAVAPGGTLEQGKTTYYGVRWFIRF
jgi:hypothetical protein